MCAYERTLHPSHNLYKVIHLYQSQSTAFNTVAPAFTHTEQQTKKGKKMTSVKQFKQENQRTNLYKNRETRNAYEQHIQTTTTEQQVPDLG